MTRPNGEKYVIGLLLFIIAADTAVLILTSPLVTHYTIHIGDTSLTAGYFSADNLVSIGLLTLVNISGLLLLVAARPSGWIVSMSAILFYTLINAANVIDFIKINAYMVAGLFLLLSVSGLIAMVCLFRTITRHRLRVNNLSYLLVAIFTAFLFIYR